MNTDHKPLLRRFSHFYFKSRRFNMPIALQGTHSLTPKLVSRGSSGWIFGYAVLAAIAIAASIYFGPGLTEQLPSQLIGP
jgi:hypothetical protein